MQSLQENYNWLNISPALVTKYNDKKHRKIEIKRKDVTQENWKHLL